jgi:hypothetical protein
MQPCTPQPQIVATRRREIARGDRRRRPCALHRDLARIEQRERIPSVASLSSTAPWIVGRSRRRGFSGKFALIFTATYPLPRGRLAALTSNAPPFAAISIGSGAAQPISR